MISGKIQKERKRYNRSFSLMVVFYREVLPGGWSRKPVPLVVPSESGDQREMIRSDLREPGTDQFRLFNVQGAFEIDMVQVHQRQETGIAPALSDMQLEIQTFELFGQHPRR